MVSNLYQTFQVQVKESIHQKKRIEERHGFDNSGKGNEILAMVTRINKFYEGPGDGEKNTYNVKITEDMTKKDVLDKVLEIIKDNCS